jgi:hypothetical protein
MSGASFEMIRLFKLSGKGSGATKKTSRIAQLNAKVANGAVGGNRVVVCYRQKTNFPPASLIGKQVADSGKKKIEIAFCAPFFGAKKNCDFGCVSSLLRSAGFSP